MVNHIYLIHSMGMDEMPAALMTKQDLICVDIFDDDKVPAQFETEDFLAQAAQLLRPGGVLLFNRLAATAKDKELSTRFFEEHFQRVFPNSYSLDVGGNFMLVSDGAAVGKMNN